MIGAAISEGQCSYSHYVPVPRKESRRRFIVREWSAEKDDVAVYERRGKALFAVAPEDCVTIINSRGDCYYAARDWFVSEPVDTDEWASAAWKFLSKRRGGERR